MKEFLNDSVCTSKEKDTVCCLDQDEQKMLKVIEESFYDAGYEVLHSRVFKEAVQNERCNG